MALPTPMLVPLLLLLLLSALLLAAAASNNTLFNDKGDRLYSGQALGNRRFYLAMEDCNLALGEIPIPRPPLPRLRWMSNTSRQHASPFGCYLQVSHKGRLHLYQQLRGSVDRIWSCGKADVAGSYALVLNINGVFGTYGPRFWSLGGRLYPPFKRRGILHSGYARTGGKGTILRDGENELLIDDNNRLVIQIYGPDGKTVVFRHDVSPEHAFQGLPRFEFTTSGELVYSDLVTGGNGMLIKRRVWSSGVTSNAVDYISALPDLGVYGRRQLVYNGATAICGVVLGPSPRDGGALSDE